MGWMGVVVKRMAAASMGLPRKYLDRFVPLDCPDMRPPQQVATGFGAEPPWIWGDAHPPQVQSVRFPACKQRPVAGRVPIGVQPTRLEEQLELVVVEERTHRPAGHGRRPGLRGTGQRG